MNNDLVINALSSVFLKIGETASFSAFEDYSKIKGRLSSKVLAEKLTLPEARLGDFEEALRQFFNHKDDPNKSRISFFRIALWLETVCKNLNVNFNLDEAISNEALAIKQVRALELILRDLVTENLGGNDNVLVKLKVLFKDEIVQKWLKNADDSAILSGTTFSELSSIFLDKNIFLGLQEIFTESNLVISKNAREALRYILEDIRIIRNYLAHNKKISALQIEALNAYYFELSEIIKKSRATKINPDSYLDLKFQNIEDFLGNLKIDNDLILSELSEIKQQSNEVKYDTKKIKKRTLLILSGIVILLASAIITIYKIQGQTENLSEIKDIVESGSDPIAKEKLRFEESVKEILFDKYNTYRHSDEYINDSIRFNKIFYDLLLNEGVMTRPELYQSKFEEFKNEIPYPEFSEFTYYKKALFSSQNNDYNSAIAYIDTALVLNKNFPQLYYRKSLLNNNPDSSLQYMNNAITLAGENSWIYIKFRGIIYDSKRSEYLNAMSDYEFYLKKRPKNLPADTKYRTLWICSMFNGKLKDRACIEAKKLNQLEMEILSNEEIDVYNYIKKNCK